MNEDQKLALLELARAMRPLLQLVYEAGYGGYADNLADALTKIESEFGL